MLLKLARPLSLGGRVLSTSAPKASAGADEVSRRADSYKTLADSRPPDWDSARPFEEIPGPKPLPIVGNIWRFMPVIGDLHGKSILDIFIRFQKKYGNVVALKGIPGQRDYVYLFDPEDIEHLLRNSGAFPKRSVLEVFVHYRTVVRKEVFQGVGGILTVQGEEWYKIRSMVNPILMQPRIIQKYTPKLDEIAGQLVENMRHFAKTDEKHQMPDDFINELYKWALESVGALALNKRFGCLNLDVPEDSEIRKLVDAVLTMFEHLYHFEITPTFWKFISTPLHKKFVQNMDVITNFITKTLNEAISEPFDQSLPEHELSVLQRLMKQDKRIAFTMVMDMLMGGLDTSGKTMGAILYFLAKHPEKQTKMRQQILSVLPDKGMPVTTEALAKLSYLKAVVKESNRIAPVALGTLRTSTKEMVLGGYQIPVGTNVTLASSYTSNSPENFKDPEKFLPERWLRETKDELSAKNANPFSSIPFGFGPRACIGMRFATLEIEVALVNIIRNFELSWEHGDMRFVSHMLYSVGDPLKLTVKELPQ